MNYFEESGLKSYLDIFSRENDPEQKVMYDIEDLVHIHKLVRKRKPFTTLEFGVGEKPINNMKMVERHYFRGKVIRSYDFGFGFIIPNS